jgi:hypothetical protein
METIEEKENIYLYNYEEEYSDSEAESVCAECEKVIQSPVVYCIVCLNEEIGEYGIKKIGTEFIVARGALSHCEEILAIIDPKIEPAKPMGLWYKFFSYLKIV